MLARLALVDGAGRQRDVVPGAGEVHGDGLADAAAGSGDERDSSDVRHVLPPPRFVRPGNGDGVGVDTRSQQRTGLGAGEHTPLDDGLAAHDHLLDADRLGVEAQRAAGQVVAFLGGLAGDGVGVEHHEVGVRALGDAAPVAQPEQVGRDAGHLADALLEREQARVGAPARRARPSGSWRGT